MIQRISRKLRNQDEEGFTLIELMVVVLIIAILIAIAIPTFLGARQKAQDRAAQSDLRNALTAAKTGYVDTQDYSTINLSSIEPSLDFVTGAASTTRQISTKTSSTTPGEIVLAAHSASGNCFYIKDLTVTDSSGNAGTYYGKLAATSAGCNATDTGF